MSSRNGYLTREEKQQAQVLYQTLQWLAEQLKEQTNIHNHQRLCQQASNKINKAGLTTDYINICHAYTLAESKPEDKNLVILASAFCGKARLIDNMQVSL